MMYEILKPVSASLKLFVETLPKHSLGKNIAIHTSESFPDLKNVQLALITVSEGRGALNEEESIGFDAFRKNLYQLFPGNWTTNMVDLGTIEAGETMEDTYVAVKLLVADLLKKKVIPVIIGGSQDLTYGMYRGYDLQEQPVNLVCVDNKIDLIDKMYFEAYRLGEIISNINIAEPVFRDADLISFDINAIKSSDLGFFSTFNPNGFDGRKVCALARYAGLSDRVTSFGVFNINNVSEKSLLITQILWYFVEGVNYRMNEYPYISKISYLKYIVPLEEQELVFYKSDVSDRWWIEIGGAEENDRRMLFPCSYEDYKQALQQIVPERWWRANKKLLA